MSIKLKDIPRGQLTPEEVEALSNKTFDYADKERVSMREAERRMKEEIHSDSIRTYILESRDDWGDFTFLEKTHEVAKAIHRGLGAIVKIPGIALKTIGEQALTRKEIAELKNHHTQFNGYEQKGWKVLRARGRAALPIYLEKLEISILKSLME